MKKIMPILMAGMMLFTGCAKSAGTAAQSEAENTPNTSESAASVQAEENPAPAEITDPATVLFTSDISPEGLVKISTCAVEKTF